MKRIICLSMCGALLMMLGSCKNEFEPAPAGDSGNAIGFSINRSKQANTRVAMTDLAALQASGFKLWGYVADFTINTGYDYITNLGSDADNPANTTPGRDVNYDVSKGGWYYADPDVGGTQAQWPTTASNFIAYAGVLPTDLKTPPTKGSATSIKQLEYVVPDGSNNAKPQKDLLVAAKLNVNKGDFATKVPLTFKHALSGIAVKAKTASAGQVVTINRIGMLNLLTEGTLDMTTLTWSGQTTKATSESPVYTNPGSATVTDAEDFVVADTNPYLVLPHATTLGKNEPNASPANVTAAESETNLYLLVQWSYMEADGSTPVSRTTLCAVVSTGNTPIVFAPNTLYTLNLTFDAYSKQIVFNAPTVADWDDTPPVETVGPDKNIGVIIPNTAVTGAGVGWAKTDIVTPGVFAATDLNFGYYYVWNRNTGWFMDESQTPPVLTGVNADGSLTTTYPTTNGGNGAWTSPPCPAGWRLPTVAEFNALWTAATNPTLEASLGQNVVAFTVGTNTVRLSVAGYYTNGVFTKGLGTIGSCYYLTQGGTASSSLFVVDVNSASSISRRWTAIGNGGDSFQIRCVKDVTQP